MPSTIISQITGIVEILLLEDIRFIIETLGAGLFVFALAVYVMYRIWAGTNAVKLKRLESEQLQQKTEAEIELIRAQTDAQTRIKDQQADTETHTRRDQMLAQLIQINAKTSEIQSEFIKTQNNTNEILRTQQAQSANIYTTLTTYRDEDEAYQARMSSAASRINEHVEATSALVKELPQKIDGNHKSLLKELASISRASDAMFADVLEAVRESRTQLNESIMRVVAAVTQDSKDASEPAETTPDEPMTRPADVQPAAESGKERVEGQVKSDEVK